MPRQFGEPLSERETDVLALLMHGQATKEIAESLQLTGHYVEQLRGRILRKLGATNMAHAVYLTLTAKLARRSGRCPVCPYRRILRKDGMLQSHRLFGMGRRFVCEGSGQTPIAGTERTIKLIP